MEENHSELLFQDDTGIERVSWSILDYLKWYRKVKNESDFEDFDKEEDLVKDLIEFR